MRSLPIYLGGLLGGGVCCLAVTLLTPAGWIPPVDSYLLASSGGMLLGVGIAGIREAWKERRRVTL